MDSSFQHIQCLPSIQFGVVVAGIAWSPTVAACKRYIPPSHGVSTMPGSHIQPSDSETAFGQTKMMQGKCFNMISSCEVGFDVKKPFSLPGT